MVIFRADSTEYYWQAFSSNEGATWSPPRQVSFGFGFGFGFEPDMMLPRVTHLSAPRRHMHAPRMPCAVFFLSAMTEAP